MDEEKIIRLMLERMDSLDVEALLSHLTEDVKFRFGNASATRGLDHVRKVFRKLTSDLRSLRHDVHDIWEVPNHSFVVVAEAAVITADQRRMQFPIVYLLKIQPTSELISAMQVFVDVSPLRQSETKSEVAAEKSPNISTPFH
jgi:ketosteroid isomerase-like protein